MFRLPLLQPHLNGPGGEGKTSGTDTPTKAAGQGTYSNLLSQYQW